jgi:hypothetical protein
MATSVARFNGLPLAVIDDTVRSDVTGHAAVPAIRVSVDTPTSARSQV